MSPIEQELKAASNIARGLDPNKPIYSADNAEDLTLDNFIHSLCSDKRTALVSVELTWKIGEWSPLFTTTVGVEVLIESVTQVYLTWFDPLPTHDSPGERHTMDAPEWAFTGRLVEIGQPFDHTPDAQRIRVRGFIEVDQDSPSEIEGVFLQVTEGSVDLPPS